MSVFFIGDVAVDEYYTADRWPGIADKDFIRELPTECGGSIANAAVVHAGLGGVTEFISLLNESPLSERLIADLAENGVSTRHMLRQPGIPESRNLIFLVEGEHVVLTVEMGRQPMVLPPETMAALRQPGLLYTTLYRARRLHAADSVLRQAALLADLRQHGRRAVFDLDVGGAAEADLPYLQGAEVVIFNQVGFRATFGHDDLEAAADWQLANGIARLVRTAAADGAAALDGDRILRAPGHKVDVVDVTGAGDTFGAALVWGLGRGRDFGSALTFATAAASRAVTRHGPRGGRASAEEVDAWRQAMSQAGAG
ncbi:carbohydrate kinase family protein [Tabrizicola oligotrophica]|uniref:Carbohydrate kinase family protein n=1 Tax=Tabrizicola oligotrophica TaxID=2710650 RepID=A0A6M0R017_9RHOB|nr:carbohydrate kinase family protein [Tabrizicola oligotrophica]NEY92232.1 carbohydrate kinase family protein [Tabrizicola oligotrophica]